MPGLAESPRSSKGRRTRRRSWAGHAASRSPRPEVSSSSLPPYREVGRQGIVSAAPNITAQRRPIASCPK